MKKLILIILDGYGIAPDGPFNAVTRARTPFLDKLWAENSFSTLKTSGIDVGLPTGQMGNSEVGHLNIGAGRIVYQDITRIDLSIENQSFQQNEVLLDQIRRAQKNKKTLHILGLVSDGGVHSSIQHLRAILETCKANDLKRVSIHAFTDGRDTPPRSGIGYMELVEKWISKIGVGQISTVCGRYYAMDRDKRWDRIEKAYNAICHGIGVHASTAREALMNSYSNGTTDEFILPTVLCQDEQSQLLPGDACLFFNFRADRARQLTLALTDPDFTGFAATVKVKDYVTFTQYHEDFRFPVLFAPQKLMNILGKVLSDSGILQLRAAETEKYPHVTFFFNGGEDTPFSGEDRLLVPSPKVATYDLKPEMSAVELTDRLCEEIARDKYPFICANFANCDMVGHTGVLAAAIKAVESVDDSMAKVSEVAVANGYALLVTADHGNAEQMWDPKTNGPHTAHTTNLVPVALVNSDRAYRLREGGRLADLAPTILEYLGLDAPSDMTGKSLLCS